MNRSALEEYMDRVKEGQNDMYHIAGDSLFFVLGKFAQGYEAGARRTMEILISRMMEENVGAVDDSGAIVDMLVLQIRKETDEVNQLIKQERISDHVDEHVHIPRTQFQEQAVEAVRIISQEWIWINRAASAVGIQPLDHSTDAPWHN